MKTLLATLLLLMFASSTSLAQMDSTSFSQLYEKETVYFNGNKVVFNGFKIKPHAALFDFSPEGLLEYKRSVTNTRRFWATYGASVGLLVGSMLTRNNRTATILLMGTAVTLSFSLHFSFRSINQLHKSIWLRNRDVLSRKF
jgi:hypothetical protein